MFRTNMKSFKNSEEGNTVFQVVINGQKIRESCRVRPWDRGFAVGVSLLVMGIRI